MGLSFSQLMSLWVQAGGDPSVAPQMAAIALAESSGNPAATNPTDNNGTQTSWGLWQISDGTHNEPPNWNVPFVNAQMAVAKYNASGFSPWGTYGNANYVAALTNNGYGSVTASGGSSWIGNVASAPAVATFVPQTSLDPFALFANWVANPGVNILYKTFAASGAILLFSLVPATAKFTPWVAAAILLLLLRNPSASSNT